MGRIVAVTATSAVVLPLAARSFTAPLVVAAALLGLVPSCIVWANAALTRRVGALSAAAATCAVSGLLMLLLVVVSPQCPGTAARCSTREIGAWTLSGALLPFIVIVSGLFLRLNGRLLRGVRHAIRRRREAQTRHPEPTAARGKREARRNARKAQRAARKKNR